MVKNIFLICIGFLLCILIFNKKFFSGNDNILHEKEIPFDIYMGKTFSPGIMYKEAVLDKEGDINKDGKTDIWIYRYKGILVKHISDCNYDGIVDNWSYFKNGRAYLDNYDTDFDGIIDQLVFHYSNENNKLFKSIILAADDMKKHSFTILSESPWHKDGLKIGEPINKEYH